MPGTSGELYSPSVKGKQLPTVQVFGLDPAGQTILWPLGSRLFDELTGTIYKYVKAGGTITANQNCAYTDATGTVVSACPATAAGCAARAGVYSAVGATAPGASAVANDYFWMAVEGPALVVATGAGYILGDPVAPDVGVAGSVIEHTNAGPTAAEVTRGINVMGFALQAESGGKVKVYLNKLT